MPSIPIEIGRAVHPPLSQTDCLTVEGLGDVPIVPGLNRWGLFTDMVNTIDPLTCDHELSGWSSSLALRCPRCGAPMFLPPECLAHIAADEAERMYELWQLAGCPPWSRLTVDWAVDDLHWRKYYPDGFDVIGLPVRNDRITRFEAEL